jgi:hypothetical protein
VRHLSRSAGRCSLGLKHTQHNGAISKLSAAEGGEHGEINKESGRNRNTGKGRSHFLCRRAKWLSGSWSFSVSEKESSADQINLS